MKKRRATNATHESLGGAHKVARSSDRSFGLVFAAFFAIVGFWPLVRDQPPRYWAAALAVGFLVVALVRPKLLGPLNEVWHQFGLLLNRIVSPVVMGLVFFLVVTPIGLIVRSLGKHPLNLKPDPEARSYWIERNPPGPDPKTMRQQF